MAIIISRHCAHILVLCFNHVNTGTALQVQESILYMM